MSRENAKKRVVGLEAAVAAMIANGIDEKSPEVVALKECLSKVKRSAEEPPISAREHRSLSRERRSVLVAHEAQRKLLEKELAEGEARVQRLKVLMEAPQQVPPPSVEWGAQITSLQQTVNQLQAERDALAEQVKHQTAMKLVERVHPMQSSVDAEQPVLDRASKRRAVGEEIPSGQQDLAAWMCSKQLEFRDALEMGEIEIVKDLVQLMAKGAVKLESFPSMVSNMVR